MAACLGSILFFGIHQKTFARAFTQPDACASGYGLNEEVCTSGYGINEKAWACGYRLNEDACGDGLNDA